MPEKSLCWLMKLEFGVSANTTAEATYKKNKNHKKPIDIAVKITPFSQPT
jgi:hypothetical protein